MFKKIIALLLLLATILHATPATQENITELYIATFDRVPDAKGLHYWLDTGWDIEAIAMSFFDQKETQAKYPEGFSLPDFINAIYANLFARHIDSEGFTYWLEALQKGETLRPLFILAVVNGALGDDAKILNNRVLVGLAFVKANRNDIVQAFNVIAEVTQETPTVGEALCKYTLAGCSDTVYEPAAESEPTPLALGGGAGGGGAATPVNNAPAATDQGVTVDEDTTDNAITLAGTDADNDTLTYTVETQPAHGTLSGIAPNMKYTPIADYAGADSFIFKVNDGTVDSSSATVTITVTDVNEKPVADAGEDQTDVEVGEEVSLDGMESLDADGDSLTYLWAFTSMPDESTAILSSTTAQAPSFTTDKVGIYILSLIVNDGTDSSDADSIAITTIEVSTTSTLKKTGQTISYDTSGAAVIDDSIKDDGYYQIGVDHSYTSNADNTVTDSVTGLIWQNDESIQKPWVTEDNYDLGNYSITSGDTATTYCEALDLGGYNDWRLPTIDELVYITDKSKFNPTIDTTTFNVILPNHYWSSTTDTSDMKKALLVNFYYGNDLSTLKKYNNYVRCVREGE